jgi:hypothetical protein
MSLSIDEIVQKWADRTIAYYNNGRGSYSWSYATNWDYSKSSELRKNSASELKVVEKLAIDYHHSQNVIDSWTFLVSRELVNDSSRDQTQTADLKSKTTDTYSWKLGGGFKIGVEVSGNVSLPLVAGGSAKWYGEINFNVEHVSTRTKDRDWGFSTPVIVPAGRKVTATQRLKEQSLKIPFTATVKLKGAAVVQFDQEVPLVKSDPHHRMWFVDIGDIIRDLEWYNEHGGYGAHVDLSGYKATGPDSIIAQEEGIMEGKYGIIAKVFYHESPIGRQDRLDDGTVSHSGGGRELSWTEYVSRTFGV